MSNGFYYLYAERITVRPTRDESRSEHYYKREQLAVFSSQEKAEAYIESSKVQDRFGYDWKKTSVLWGCLPSTETVEFLPLDLEPCA